MVIGAGAAGLMAGIAAARAGARVLLLEKNRKAGVKILMSGGTRCNITQNTDNRGIIQAFGANGKFLHSSLAAFGVEETLVFFNSAGVATKVEPTGKIFPQSDKALDVLNALLGEFLRAGGVLSLAESLQNLDSWGEGFSLATANRRLHAKKIIITTGGLSFPGCGTTGDGYRFATQFGHGLIPTFPALAPLQTNLPWVSGLRGVTIPDVEVTACSNGAPKGKNRGSLLFAHFGLSGPVILNVSKNLTTLGDYPGATLSLDFLPGIPEPQLEERIMESTRVDGKKMIANSLGDLLPKSLVEAVLAQGGFALEKKCAGLTKEERRRMVQGFKRCRIPISGSLGYAKAEVTTGGIPLSEVDSRNLQSKIRQRLYFAGEILDLDGLIGGYNFQAAWSTGYLAGVSAARD